MLLAYEKKRRREGERAREAEGERMETSARKADVVEEAVVSGARTVLERVVASCDENVEMVRREQARLAEGVERLAAELEVLNESLELDSIDGGATNLAERLSGAVNVHNTIYVNTRSGCDRNFKKT